MGLSGLQRAPFEPLGSVKLKILSLKTVLLTVLTSIKRVGNLYAFSASEISLEFIPADSCIILRHRTRYVPKVPTIHFRDQLQALPLEEIQIQALYNYVARTLSLRSSEQLFVCFGGKQNGKGVSKTENGPLASGCPGVPDTR